MHLFGLTGIELASLLAGGVLAAAVLYVLKLRRRTVLVSFAPLWRSVVRDRPATSLFERLRRLVSFLLQVAFVALVLFAIARPRLSEDAERERRFVIVVDASASMQAVSPDGAGPPPTRLDEAKELARTLIGRLGETDRAMILRAGLVPQPLTAFESDRRRLLDVLARLRPDDCRSDLDASVRFALRLVEGRPDRVFVFTDRPEVLSGCRWCRVGRPLDNLALVRFAGRPTLDSPGEYELLFEVRSFASTDADCRLRIEDVTDGVRLIEDRPVRLASGARAADVLRGIARTDMKLRATLTRADGSALRDALALDDTAFAVVRAARVTRVLVVGEENFFLESVLRSDPLIDWRRVAPAGYAGEASDADVVIFDNCTPATQADRAVFINPRGLTSPVASAAELTDVFVDRLAVDHPVMRFVGRLADLNIAHSRVLTPEPGDVVLASCAGSPVMLARASSGRRLVAFGFDLRESDLVLRVAFPKIFRNALSWLVAPGAPDGDDTLTAGKPVGRGVDRRVPVHVAFHELAGRTVAVNLADETVSDLRATPAPDADASLPLEPVRGGVGVELWPVLVALAAALTLFEWISYHRRWTV